MKSLFFAFILASNSLPVWAEDLDLACSSMAVQNEAKEHCFQFEMTDPIKGDKVMQETLAACRNYVVKFYEIKLTACEYRKAAKVLEGKIFPVAASGGSDPLAGAANLKEYAQRLEALQAKVRDFYLEWSGKFQAKGKEFADASMIYYNLIHKGYKIPPSTATFSIEHMGNSCQGTEFRQYKECRYTRVPGMLLEKIGANSNAVHFGREFRGTIDRTKRLAEGLQTEAYNRKIFSGYFADQAGSLKSAGITPPTGKVDEAVGPSQDPTRRKTPSYGTAPDITAKAGKFKSRGTLESAGKAIFKNDLEGLILSGLRSFCGTLGPATRVACYLTDSTYVAIRKDSESLRQFHAVSVNTLRKEPESTSADIARAWKEFIKEEAEKRPDNPGLQLKRPKVSFPPRP